jgi:predicted ATPase/DNA-binding winged helix-turn-helix (wHTH) protein
LLNAWTHQWSINRLKFYGLIQSLDIPMRDSGVDQPTFRCGSTVIDIANRRFTRDGVNISLEPKVFNVISQLIGRAGQLVSREELLDAVWGHRYVTTSALGRTLTLARRAFGDETAEPRFIQTVHGLGYRFIGSPEPDSSAASVIVARFEPPPFARLPTRIQELIGRQSELDVLVDLLRRSRAVTILGPGGMGKTQCALELARRVAPDFPDGVWVFDLARIREADEALQMIASALDIPQGISDDTLERICRFLGARQLLFLVDNCDRIAAGVGALIFALLRGTESLKVLATSQTPLNCVGEQVMWMPPLRLPTAQEADAEDRVTTLAAVPVIAMLVARIKAIQPSFRLAKDNATTIIEICRRLDGMPLALELAADRFTLLSADQVLERLKTRFLFLKTDVTGRDPRHRSLALLLEWSFGLLTSSEQRLLSWLSVFSQGWTIDAALSMAPALTLRHDAVVDLLSGLVKKSLVSVDPSLTPPRYWLLESVHEFASERLLAGGQSLLARDAHLQWIWGLAGQSEKDILNGRIRESIHHLLHEHANINAAIEFGTGLDVTDERALEVAGSLMLYLKARGALLLAVRWCDLTLARQSARATRARGRALLCLGVAGFYIGPSKRVPETTYSEAIGVFDHCGDQWGLACASAYYAMSLARDHRSQEAHQHLLVAEKLADALADPWLRSLVALGQGLVLLERGAKAEAIKLMEPVCMLSSDTQQQLFIGAYVGLAKFGIQDFGSAAAHWRDALLKSIEIRHPRGAAGCVEGCAYLVARRGEAAAAARYMGTAAKIREASGSPLNQFWVLAHVQVASDLRDSLGDQVFEALHASGWAAREEDIYNEVEQTLAQLAIRPFGT